MAQDKREPTQKTQPKKGKPVEIPVPKRSEFDRLLKKSREAAQEVVDPACAFVTQQAVESLRCA